RLASAGGSLRGQLLGDSGSQGPPGATRLRHRVHRRSQGLRGGATGTRSRRPNRRPGGSPGESQGLSMTNIFRVLAMVCAVGIMTVQLPVHAQEKVRVLSDTPLQPALIEIGEAFRRDTGNEVEF